VAQLLKNIKRSIGNTQYFRPWVQGHASALLSQFSNVNQNEEMGYSDQDHLLAAASWLATAQDATPDGGVVGRYRLNGGWTSSYPETTGYIVPTFLQLAEVLKNPSYISRAERAIEFLLNLQLESGAFPGAEIAENTTEPSPFNTGQILNGLIAWHRHSNDEKVLQSAYRAADWLVSVQDDDGAFRQYFYNNKSSTYSAHLTCWLAEFGAHVSEDKYLRSVDRHMNWILENYSTENGWFERVGFDETQHTNRVSYTHTIAYALWGVLFSGEILKRKDLIDAVMKASTSVARRTELSRSLPGLLDWRWRSAENFTCLTGNSQMALIWMRLFELTNDLWFLNPAFKTIDDVKRAQFMKNSNPGIRGGVAGSFPIWGPYIFGGIPNWAAKFFIDALIKKTQILQNIESRPEPKETIHDDIPMSLPSVTPLKDKKSPNIVVLTRTNSYRPAHFASAWEKLGVSPSSVVFVDVPEKPLQKRLINYLAEHGFSRMARRILHLQPSTNQSAPTSPRSTTQEFQQTAADYCQQIGIDPIHLDSLSSPESIQKIKDLKPDLFIQAGVGILRDAVLSLPTLGTLNVHMSILPTYRGMNVAEWASINGHQIGCTVHLIDSRIDVGDILLARKVDVQSSRSVIELRSDIDEAQRQTLAEVIAFIARAGRLPPQRPQRVDEGRQYFSMHRDLLHVLERDLANR
jgi:folate-dependent phosphoribosylglycinamide formyltransferase PurN